ncbi:hypothetical protein R3W88_015958 [Solanum pinnatisectum]|uniref:Uncharacterized protein n=1 Tax=Solanum pinnatisectum TaxID=50273 RepID=A0AAV9KZ45_9SOLN|nr:hypothetical protein R3W88_015958 [Solanum pinnatisectum]
MKKISLRNCNGILFISSISGSAITFRAYSSCHCSKKSISVEDKLGLNSGNLDDAVPLFHQMKFGIPISDFILNNMINSFCLMYRVDCAFSVLPIYLKNGVSFNAVTFTTLIRGLFAENKVKDAVELFKKLLERNREYTDIAFYSVVINGLCKNGKLDEAHAVFEKHCFTGLLPDVRTYNVLINGFCLEQLFDEAKDILRKMEDNGCSPDRVTYNVIVQGFLRCNKISEMTSFMKEMVGRGFSFDAGTAALLVNVVRENPSVLDMIPELHSNNKK